jgi:SAM-dependent methyltransferase
VRAVVRALLWPLRRFFDPRFAGVGQAVQVNHDDLAARIDHTGAQLDETLWLLRADMDASNEAVSVLGRSLTELRDVTERMYDVTTSRYLTRLASGSVRDIDEHAAQLLNYSVSHEGFAAQKHVWFNPPLLVQYAPNDVRVAWVNERIAEMPYVFRALARIQPQATVLDIGSTESTVCLSLAALGYTVTALDPRPNPLSHPNLIVVTGTIEGFEANAPFDAVVCLSTIEHIGTDAYGQEGGKDDADLKAMRRIRELTRKDGVLVLTTPYGTQDTNAFERTYSQERLTALLDGWTVDDVTLLERVDALTWLPVADDVESQDEAPAERVALVTARRKE